MPKRKPKTKSPSTFTLKWIKVTLSIRILHRHHFEAPIDTCETRCLGEMRERLRELGAGDGNRRQLVVATYLLAGGIGTLIPGALADRFGRRPVLLSSIAGYALLSLVIAFVHDFTTLLVLRGIQGLLASGLFVVPSAIVRDRYEGDQMARLFSLISAVFITVPVFAPSLGQAICGIRGHDSVLHFESQRVMMRCTSCGHDTPGWEISGRGPRRRFEGDPRRHLLKPQRFELRKSA